MWELTAESMGNVFYFFYLLQTSKFSGNNKLLQFFLYIKISLSSNRNPLINDVFFLYFPQVNLFFYIYYLCVFFLLKSFVFNLIICFVFSTSLFHYFSPCTIIALSDKTALSHTINTIV